MFGGLDSLAEELYFGPAQLLNERGVALIVGMYTRWVAVLLAVHLLFAAYLGHAANGWLFSAKGGGYEYPVFWAIACFALALLRLQVLES